MRMPLLCTVHEVVNWRVESSIRGAVLLHTLHRVRLITSRDGPRSSMLPGYFLVLSTKGNKPAVLNELRFRDAMLVGASAFGNIFFYKPGAIYTILY